MQETPIGDQAQEALQGQPYAPGGATVALRNQAATAALETVLAPYTLNLEEWLRGIASADDFPDSDPDAASMGILAQILLAETSAEVLASLNLERAKELCGDTPGGRSPVLEIRGARAMKSTYEEGAACYVIVTAFRLDIGEQIRFTTGARAVQAAIWKHCYMDWMPFRAALEIRRERTQRGFYPLNLVAGI